MSVGGEVTGTLLVHGDCHNCGDDMAPETDGAYGGVPMCVTCRRAYLDGWREAVLQASLILKDAFPDALYQQGRDWFRGQMLNELKLRGIAPPVGLVRPSVPK